MPEKVLFIGLLCADVVSICDDYPPPEDSKYRCIEQTILRGGNASNSSTVCALLGGSTELLCSMAISPLLPYLKTDLDKYGISYEHCVEHSGHKCPISVVINNVQNGTRTLLMSPRTLPELSFADFAKINLDEESYSWIHFEGCPNLANMHLMMQRVIHHNERAIKKIGLSLEIEKKRPGMDMESLLPYPDVTFISKDYALLQGYTDMEQAVRQLVTRCKPGASVVCAWGEHGAAVGSFKAGVVTVTSVAAYPPPKVIDTLGAGDTFIGSAVFALSRGLKVNDAINFGCRVAGAKCGMIGYEGLASLKDSHQFITANGSYQQEQ